MLALAGGLAAGLALTLAGGGGSPKPDLTVRNNTLVRIDPKTNAIAAVTPVGVSDDTGVGAVDVAVGGETVWVYNWVDHTVRAVDPRRNAVERIVAIGGFTPFSPGNSIAADPAGAWVLSSAGGSGVVTRVRPGVALPRSFTLGSDPLAVAAGPAGVWVATRSAGRQAVVRIGRNTGSVLATVPVHGAGIRSIAVGEAAVWILQQDGTISRIDPRAGRITGRVSLRASEVAQIAAGDGGVWATVFLPGRGNVLTRVDARTLRVTRRVGAPGSRGPQTAPSYSTVGP